MSRFVPRYFEGDWEANGKPRLSAEGKKAIDEEISRVLGNLDGRRR